MPCNLRHLSRVTPWPEQVEDCADDSGKKSDYKQNQQDIKYGRCADIAEKSGIHPR